MRGVGLLVALHAAPAAGRNATLGAQGPPPRLIVELAATPPVAEKRPSGTPPPTTPALSATPSATTKSETKSELFGFDVSARPPCRAAPPAGPAPLCARSAFPWRDRASTSSSA